MDSPHGVALVAAYEGQVVGLLVGTTGHQDHHAWVVRHRAVPLAARGAISLLRRPHLAAYFVRTRLAAYARSVYRMARRPQRAPADTRASGSEDPAVLSHLAVAEGLRGRGMGRALVAAYLQAASASGARQAQVVTTADSDAESFYERIGWRVNRNLRTRDGVLMTVYEHDLGRVADPSASPNGRPPSWPPGPPAVEADRRPD